MEIFASTQNPTKTQNFCAKVCGVDKNKVGGGGGVVVDSLVVDSPVVAAPSLLVVLVVVVVVLVCWRVGGVGLIV